MSTTQLRAIGLLFSALVVFGSGVLLTRSGRPYGSPLLTVHKLVDLAAVIAIGVLAYQANRANALSAVEWAIVGIAGLLVVAVFASGGVVSATERAPSWVLSLHRVAPWFAGVLAAASVYISVSRG